MRPELFEPLAESILAGATPRRETERVCRTWAKFGWNQANGSFGNGRRRDDNGYPQTG